MKRVLLRVLLVLLIVFAALLLLVGGYLLYAFSTYGRIGNGSIPVEGAAEEIAETGKEYSILSYNIGFGAYEPDYGFFMDGGTESWAFSKERLTKNMENISRFLSEQDADLYLVQEVDSNSTRSYHVDEREYLKSALPGTAYHWAQNYDSVFIAWPLLKPHGKSRAGQMTFSSLSMESAERIELPVETGFSKFFDLDRCYSKSLIPVRNGRKLVLYNLHLSAYTTDGTIAETQLSMLMSDMQKEYEAGNYCVAGGDFNKDLSGDCQAYFGTDSAGQTWAQPIPDVVFDGLNVSLVFPYDEDTKVPSCRNADGPLSDGQFKLTVDGFLVSDNVTVTDADVVDLGFSQSDHNPVSMNFMLNE